MSFRMIAGALALALVFGVSPEPALANPASLAEAKALAAKEKKPLLVDFYATWCGPCKRFAADAESDASVQKSLGQVVLFKTDAEKGDGIQLAAEHNVKSYPTFVVLNADGKTMERWSGYEKQWFVNALSGAVADPTTVEQKEARFAKSPTAKDAARLSEIKMSRGDVKNAVVFSRKAAELEPTTERRLAVVEGMAYSMHTKTFTAEEVAQERDKFLATGTKDPASLSRLVGALRFAGSQAGMPTLVAPALGPALVATEGATDPAILAQRQELLVDKALLVDKDPALAGKLKKETMPEGWMTDSARLNSFAWWSFENNVNLPEAEALAKKGVELAPAGAEKAMVLDTLAEILFAEGKKSEAVAAIEKAVKEDPAKEHYKKQVDRFKSSAVSGTK